MERLLGPFLADFLTYWLLAVAGYTLIGTVLSLLLKRNFSLLRNSLYQYIGLILPILAGVGVGIAGLLKGAV